MRDDTTIIIITQNNQRTIRETIKKLREYKKKNQNIKEIIITDNNSNDQTKNIIKEESTDGIRSIINDYKRKDKQIIIQTLTETTTKNAIILEPTLNTRLHQIRNQIKKLRKTDLVLMNRQHKKSRTKYEDKIKELKTKTKNLIIRIITGITYEDPTNNNKALQTKKILFLIKKTKSKKHFWLEIMKNPKTKITETSTHYIEEQITREDIIQKLINDFKELIRIKKIK